MESLKQQLAESQKSRQAADLRVEIPTERITIQGHPPTATVTKVELLIDAVREEGAKRLAGLRERAVKELLNRKVVGDGQLAALRRDIEGWEGEVIAALEQYAGVDEVTTFRVLGTFAVRVTGGINAEHNRELAMLWERVRRLENVISRLSR